MGSIGFTLYDITKHSIDLLCNDLIGAEGIKWSLAYFNCNLEV